MSDPLYEARKKILDQAHREIEELERLAALAEKHGLTLAPRTKGGIEVVDPDPEIGRVVRHKKSWRETILEALSNFPSGATRAEIKSRLSDTHLGPRLAETDAAFYGSISKMVERNQLVEHNGKLFLPFHYRKFMAEVKAGRATDAPAQSISNSAAFVQEYLASTPNGATGVEIFNAYGDKHPGAMSSQNSVYNLLRRLVSKGTIVKKGTKYYPKGDENGGSAEPPDANAEEAGTLFGALNPNPACNGK